SGRRAVILVLEEGAPAGLAGAPVRFEGRQAGFVQADSHSYVIGRRLALAVLDTAAAWPNLRFELAAGEAQVAAESRSAPLFLTRTVVESLNL
ncbi:MAG TPA: glycine cleavage T C-terminal barrel domain-containing protein, partial [Thermoanaerobaculia bacterium]|nr:glycine cleavage T C-terminal barrel domain-containing protein [Thermoanaerobaculia bacterium]